MTKAADQLNLRILALLGDGGDLATANRIRVWLQNEYLPGSLLGMKGAAERLGLRNARTGEPSSNSLAMRLRRGHPLLIVAEIEGNRITTTDLVDEYVEILPNWHPAGDHDPESEAS